MSQPESSEMAPVPKPHYWKQCALYYNAIFFGGKGLGMNSPFTTTIQVHKETDRTSWQGFTIEVPYGPNIEDEGFGMCHAFNHASGRHSVFSTQTYKIEVKFPREHSFFVEEITPELLARIPKTDKKLCRLNIYLDPGHYSFVKGFGTPFSHPGAPWEVAFTEDKPNKMGDTLVDMCEQREYSFIVAAPSNAV